MNIGLVIVGHGHLASEMVKVIEFINNEPCSIAWVDVVNSDDTAGIREELKAAIQKVDQGFGVLLLADIFGATPCNLCVEMIEPGTVELLTGYNLPLLLKLSQIKPNTTLKELMLYLPEYGKRNVFCKDNQP